VAKSNLSDKTVSRVAASIHAVKRPADVVVASIHWGRNWGYDIPRAHTAFAHALIDEARVDVVHGHSSHHAKGIEVYNDKLILYGCGDLLTDYEGIPGCEAFRGDLALMYVVTLEPSSGELVRCEITPMQMRRFQLHHVSREDAEWVRDTLQREGRPLRTQVALHSDQTLTLRWGRQNP
jgi:poly-gamma-glutamate synthesis protein (capsule biosynthesis protein)